MTSAPNVEAYFDWAASTPMRPAALDAMVSAARAGYANPTGAHRGARAARRIVDDARDVVADAFDVHPADVIFCGSGTEADNLAIFGANAASIGSVPVCSAVEHHAVLHPVEHLGGRIVGVDGTGRVDLGQLEVNLDDTVSIVSVMTANNETGVVQPLAAIAERVRSLAPNALIHTDAVQAFPWIDVATATEQCDLVAISGHKFGGPKGVGALIVRSGTKIAPHMLGGGQEFDLRPGTHNVAGIAAFGVAVAETVAERADVITRVGALRDRLADGLIAAVGGVTETGIDGGTDATGPTRARDRAHKVPGSCHLCFEGIESEALLFMLERDGIYASAASSCASGAQDPSHVLAAMGYDRALAGGSLRLSLGYGSTDADVDHALDVIPAAVERLRAGRAA